MTVSELMEFLSMVDPEMEIQLTMNREYTSDITSIYIMKNRLYFDDVPTTYEDASEYVLYDEEIEFYAYNVRK